MAVQVPGLVDRRRGLRTAAVEVCPRPSGAHHRGRRRASPRREPAHHGRRPIDAGSSRPSTRSCAAVAVQVPGLVDRRGAAHRGRRGRPARTRSPAAGLLTPPPHIKTRENICGGYRAVPWPAPLSLHLPPRSPVSTAARKTPLRCPARWHGHGRQSCRKPPPDRQTHHRGHQVQCGLCGRRPANVTRALPTPAGALFPRPVPARKK